MSNSTGKEVGIEYKTSIIDASGEVVESHKSRNILTAGNSELAHEYMLENPHLWNGKKDPYLYQVQVDILENGILIDSKTEPLGLRYFHMDPNEGFFLNGAPIALRIPISLVLSFTIISIILLTPTIPAIIVQIPTNQKKNLILLFKV